MARSPESKQMTVCEVIAWRHTLRAEGKRLVVTNGCFDVLHRGHVEYLAQARQFGDVLLVAVNSDASIQAVKGPDRPICSQADRAYLLASLEAVDAVVIFTTPHATELLRTLQPDVYVKGGDYTEQTLVQEEYRLLKDMGCEIQLLAFIPGLSTTELIRRVRAVENGPCH